MENEQFDFEGCLLEEGSAVVLTGSINFRSQTGEEISIDEGTEFTWTTQSEFQVINGDVIWVEPTEVRKIN